ncbi:hypothetical protein GUITHDRAFT_110003 [Guillardia theta CCMP2712]|uniref:Ubiquitin-like domain-containing protein n=2 Tax=Guillardia theta TaxID=55529 RepID=L1J7A5_GUITC|nr:hypothetical protein GUITHDRAFT_110003 [Guillardia theta CCMP2712]EKX44217.1 hypothetical protein GUITHDRAFT_110003 [Guillardia theta CCMP2712]|eukprot:XP_005831197.1 hypothetical protein GUITHDRAFT_110003 [Guillardia theta CCMP2712]
MPDGSEQTLQVDQGQTVEYVRAYLHENCGLPFSSSTLSFQARKLLDPMSLVDCGVSDNSNLTCTVQSAADGGDM